MFEVDLISDSAEIVVMYRGGKFVFERPLASPLARLTMAAAERRLDDLIIGAFKHLKLIENVFNSKGEALTKKDIIKGSVVRLPFEHAKAITEDFITTALEAESSREAEEKN